MTKASNSFMAGIDEVGKSWGWLLTLGILLMVLGIVCLGTARTATTVSILTFGWILVISGLAWFVGAFQTRSWGGVFVYMLNAIIRCATGYALLRRPDAGHDAASRAFRGRRHVSYALREHDSIPGLGMDGIVRGGRHSSRPHPAHGLGCREHIFRWFGNRRRPDIGRISAGRFRGSHSQPM